MKSYQQFFAELKRRQVFKVAGVYGVVAFALIQVADPLAKALLLPDAFLTYVVAVLLLGFPLAIVLAWAFEVTPQGVRKAEAATADEIAAIVAQPASKRWPAGLLALVGVGALVAGAWWVGRQGGGTGGDEAAARPGDIRLALEQPDEDERPSIAVLPFDDMSPEGDQAYFSDGMTEEILNVLAKVRELRVSARTSAFAFRGHELTAEQLGDTLRVRYLVEGSVRKAGNRLRITAQLIDAADGSHLWSEQYDRELEDVFAIQTEIAEAIADELRVPLGLEGDETLVMPTGDLTAYDLYLAGRAQMRLRGEGLREAISLFEAAIARDSSWAPAWAALAEASEIKIWHADVFGVEFADLPSFVSFVDSAQVEAEGAARRALELDPRNASALVALGSVQRNRAEWSASEASYRRALALDPDNAEAHQQYADLLFNMGRLAESVRAADRAAALDPAAIRAEALGFALVLDDRANEAVEVVRQALERAPEASRTRALGNYAFRALDAGLAEEFVESFLEAARREDSWFGDQSPEWLNRRHVERYARAIVSGDLASLPIEAREDLWPQDWMRFGERDSAVVALVRYLEEAAPFGRVADVWYPRLDPVRSDPRVQAALAERGLAGVEVQRTPPNERRRPIVLGPGPPSEAAP